MVGRQNKLRLCILFLSGVFVKKMLLMPVIKKQFQPTLFVFTDFSKLASILLLEVNLENYSSQDVRAKIVWTQHIGRFRKSKTIFFFFFHFCRTYRETDPLKKKNAGLWPSHPRKLDPRKIKGTAKQTINTHE